MPCLILTLFCILITGCSGSLTDSGIFWSKEQALENQKLKEEELVKAQKEHQLVRDSHTVILQKYQVIEAEVKALNEEIKELHSEVKILEKYATRSKKIKNELQEKRKIAQAKVEERDKLIEVLNNRSKNEAPVRKFVPLPQ